MMRPALLVPESLPTDVLLTRMRTERAQMAILVDEYGGTAGLVTLHDLVERLVGPVLDFQEVADDGIEVLPDGQTLLGGLALVHDVNEQFGLEIDEEEADTIGGFVVTRLGRIPVPGDEVMVDGYVLMVESLEGRRVERLRLARKPAQVDA